MVLKKITRRKLLKDAAKASMAGALYFSMPFPVNAHEEKKVRVVLIREKDLWTQENKLDKEKVQNMLDMALCKLTEKDNYEDAWKEIIIPDDIVGVKSNEWRHLYTPPELEDAIKQRIITSGVDAQNVSIKDRGVRHDEVFKNATALINVRPLRTHNWSGVGSLLKNYIMFTSQPSQYHPDTCADLAAIWKYPEIKGKTRLNILVVFTPLFHGVGPHHFSREYTWKYNGLLLGFDPVAVDTVGVQILLAKRKEYFGKERPINPPPKHIFLADTRHKLGTADSNKIELIKIGWKEEEVLDI